MSTTMPTTLPIPSRHPARSLQTKSDDPKQATDLTSEQLDLWEHATVLYHGFDWQASAQTFLFLSRTINRNLESTLCLLNAALVFARLGEYSTSSQILDEAEPDDKTLAFTMFLMGNVEFELGNFEKAEDSLKVALHSLKGSTQRFYDFGLDYVLRASHVQQSLRIFESKNELVGMLGSLGALPADGVFEAPSRYRSSAAADPRASPADSRNSMDSSELPPLTDRSSPSAPSSPIESVQSIEYGSDGMQWHGLPEEPDVHVKMPRTSSIAKGKQPIRPLEQSTNYFDGHSRPSTKGTLSRFDKVLPPIRKARKLAYEPREARVQGDSIGGLADFIRKLPSQNKTMVAKEAKIKDDTTMSLATFIRDSGPGATPAQVLPDDASDRSVYSTDEADSVRSDDLRNMVDEGEYSVKYRAPSPPPSKYPHRSGFGSMLLHENMRQPTARRPNEPLSSDTMHNLLVDDDNVSLDWPLTDDAAYSLRESFISADSSATELPSSRNCMNRGDFPEPLRVRDESRPMIPNRTSSLLRQFARGRSASPRPQSTVSTTSTIASSRFFSHVANLR